MLRKELQKIQYWSKNKTNLFIYYVNTYVYWFKKFVIWEWWYFKRREKLPGRAQLGILILCFSVSLFLCFSVSLSLSLTLSNDFMQVYSISLSSFFFVFLSNIIKSLFLSSSLWILWMTALSFCQSAPKDVKIFSPYT